MDSYPLQKNMELNLGKYLASKYGQKLLETIKMSVTYVLNNASKRPIQKLAEATDDLVGNKIAETITKVATKTTYDD